MPSRGTDLLNAVADYYSAKLAQHGPTARGADWNGEEGQIRRFELLCRIVGPADRFSINDLGCGYGALYEYLAGRYDGFSYSGFDISESMVRAAEQIHRGKTEARFAIAGAPDQMSDYGMASGIFNIRLDRSDAEWSGHVEATLDVLDSTSRLGFAFNCLTSYSDADKMRDHLYYADPRALFDHCMRRYGRSIALLHDYGLYEFTMRVRKQP